MSYPCPVCGTGNIACTGETRDLELGTFVHNDPPAAMPQPSGPLVRVDTNGRGNLLKVPESQAAYYIATHPGSSLWPH